MNKIEIIKQAIERQKGQCFVRNYSVAHEFVWGNHVNESATLSNDIINLLPLSSTEVNGVTEKNGWVSVFEKRPEIGQAVLVYIDNGSITVAYRTKATSSKKGYSTEYSWQLFGDILTAIEVPEDAQITHWQPLPPAPPINK